MRRLALLLSAAMLAQAPALAATVQQTDLVSDGSVAATIIDPNLVNPWGVAYGPGGAFWVSDNATGLTTLYDGTGAIQSLVVGIPAPAGQSGPSAPTGQVFNTTQDFAVTQNGVSGVPAFLFATEGGTISGWAPSVDFPSAVTAIDKSAEKAVYKGIAIATDANGVSTLLATNFNSGFVEMYDAQFNPLGQFRDQGDATTEPLPRDYAPYNVQVLQGHVFVTYAKQDSARHDSVSAPHAGFVDEVTPKGRLIRRIASHGALNAPWGLAIAPPAWGSLAGALLVGNFGDGTVSAYRIGSGSFITQLHQPHGAGRLRIDGLWALTQGTGALNADPTKIYFTAGPQGETHGVFGSLAYNP
jgi:uncharacterized protein (TIGR03118 family)